ncbi:unnamed protein product, partial [Mesorhabditis spiculigera]
MTENLECPDCRTRSVAWRFTWRGIFYAILCFPCGLFCCFRRRERHCTKCDCDVVSALPETVIDNGYSYREYGTIKRGLPPRSATIISEKLGHRNPAFTTDSSQTEDSGMSSTLSEDTVGRRTSKDPLV